MKNEDINRLNELQKRFSNDEDYKEYEELLHQAWSENKNACAERSLLGEVNGDRYILLLPYDKLDFVNGEWKYKHYGFDMEICRQNGSIIVLCQSLCNHDAKYFVDRMLADKEKAEQEKQNGTDVELIRCKDCKHREWDVIDVPCGQTKRIDWCNIRFNADGENVEVAPNDFCSGAKRKEE